MVQFSSNGRCRNRDTIHQYKVTSLHWFTMHDLPPYKQYWVSLHYLVKNMHFLFLIAVDTHEPELLWTLSTAGIRLREKLPNCNRCNKTWLTTSLTMKFLFYQLVNRQKAQLLVSGRISFMHISMHISVTEGRFYTCSTSGRFEQ